MEPEQGEVINGPNLGDLSRRRAGPSAGNRSAAKPLEHEPEFVLSETFDLFRATWPFELAASRGTIFEPVQMRPTLALSLFIPKQTRAILSATDSDETSDCVQWCLGFFLFLCLGFALPCVCSCAPLFVELAHFGWWRRASASVDWLGACPGGGTF